MPKYCSDANHRPCKVLRISRNRYSYRIRTDAKSFRLSLRCLNSNRDFYIGGAFVLKTRSYLYRLRKLIFRVRGEMRWCRVWDRTGAAQTRHAVNPISWFFTFWIGGRVRTLHGQFLASLPVVIPRPYVSVTFGPLPPFRISARLAENQVPRTPILFYIRLIFFNLKRVPKRCPVSPPLPYSILN